MKKIFTGLIIVFVLMLGTITSLAEDLDKYVVYNETGETGKYSTLTKAMEGIKELGKGKYVITLTGDTIDSDNTIEVMDGYTITLESQGDHSYKITRNNNGRQFCVSSKGKLIIENIILDGNRNEDNEGGIFVSSGGELILNDGLITGNNSIIGGAGIYVEGGTFTMNGGEISGNESAAGGGVYVEDGTFIMNGGKISSNTVNGNNGGGVYIEYGTFTMSGGEISDNFVTQYGGGIFVEGGKIILNGGKISNNIANGGGGVSLFSMSTLIMNEGEISDNIDGAYSDHHSGYGGGGVFLSSNSNFTMNGGKISDNTSKSILNSGYGGGGVYVEDGTFTMSKGEISGNTATSEGGGVFVSYGTFTMEDGNICKNTAIGEGGGVFLGDGNITMENGNINRNTAIDGGGIFTENFSNLTTSEKIVFSENMAINGLYNPPNDLSSFNNIKFLATSAEGLIEPNHPLNNWDINYTEGEKVSVLELVYDANGGSGEFTTKVTSKLKHIVKSPTDIGILRDGYEFISWNTKADGTGTSYVVGDKFTITEDTTLYAEWKENTKPPVKPEGTIKNITLIGGKATLTEKVEEQLKEFKLNRISGKNRYATSVQVSKAYKNSDTVVLASGEKYTDELTATVLASKLDVPILLSEKDVVPEVVMKEIERLGATKVILIGEKGTLSKSVETQLSKYKLERIGGVDRYETAVLIGDQVRTITGNKTQSILVDGTNFPDAIAMTSMGVEQGLPIILTQPNELNKITEKAVKDWGITKVTIGGGTASVSSNIENTLKATVEVERIKGRDRYETSVLVAKQVYKNPTHAVVASGEVFPDAIVGAPYAAKNKYPIILSRGNNVPSIVMDYVTGK